VRFECKESADSRRRGTTVAHHPHVAWRVDRLYGSDSTKHADLAERNGAMWEPQQQTMAQRQLVHEPVDFEDVLDRLSKGVNVSIVQRRE